MISMGQMLQAMRQLEMIVGSALHQAKLVETEGQALEIALKALDAAQKELERLTEN